MARGLEILALVIRDPWLHLKMEALLLTHFLMHKKEVSCLSNLGRMFTKVKLLVSISDLVI